MHASKLPTPEAWAEAIKAVGFELDIDPEFSWNEFEGFLPAKYKGRDAGFELYKEDFDLSELTDSERADPGDRPLLVTLITHSDMREYMSSMIAAAVLCVIADGKLAEGGEPPFIAAEANIEWARSSIPAVEKLMAHDGFGEEGQLPARHQRSSAKGAVEAIAVGQAHAGQARLAIEGAALVGGQTTFASAGRGGSPGSRSLGTVRAESS
ncbi:MULTISPECIES: hypothetical protein [Variovorax]|uniref:hypothetical protein n=1 Tax=Variovorax TaxID=34072 RepID=UPI002863EED7|nr:hypothetical protein [Variovorax sp. 3319]MDR6890760.1 hypothetical protein [Variovorax sp. 3319]